MLQFTLDLLLAFAFVAAKVGVLDRRAELVTMPASMVLFAAVAIGSYNTQVGLQSSLTTVQQPGLAVLGLGGTMLMLIYTILSALDRLPDPDLARRAGEISK